MSMDKVLEFTFGLFKKEPKIVLPNILEWVPTALFLALILHGAWTFSKFLSLERIQQLLGTALFWELVKTALVYVVIGIPILILFIIISILLDCVYSDITRQAYSKKKIFLTKAFSVAKSRFLSLLWTYFLQFLIVVLILSAFFGLGLFLIVIRIGIIGFIGLILLIILGAITVLLAFVFFYETPAIVVLENKSGLEAIRRSYSIARNNFWSLVAVMLIVFIVTGLVTSGLASIPYVGLIISSLAGLFLSTWNSMIPALFYYEYEREKI